MENAVQEVVNPLRIGSHIREVNNGKRYFIGLDGPKRWRKRNFKEIMIKINTRNVLNNRDLYCKEMDHVICIKRELYLEISGGDLGKLRVFIFVYLR